MKLGRGESCLHIPRRTGRAAVEFAGAGRDGGAARRGARCSNAAGSAGRVNPLALLMQWHPDGEIVRGWATYCPAYAGPIGHVHGGFVAVAFDDP